jgi:hypothetical protein
VFKGVMVRKVCSRMYIVCVQSVNVCSRIGMCAQGCGYMCSRMCIVCVRGLVYVLRDVHSLCSKCECVFKDWYMCSGMYIVCVQGLVYVFKDWYMCSRIGICAQGCT